MKTKRSNNVYSTAAFAASIMLMLPLLIGLLPMTPHVLGQDQVTGAIWTTDPHGERVNGNLYTKAQDVHLAGGPHMEGSAGLADGIYVFQVTDPSGKTLLSKDSYDKRRVLVENGTITSIDGGTHKYNPDETRGYGIVVQLWPFTYSPNKGGVYKLWVTKESNFNPPQGIFGFIPALSKTDNFKVMRVSDEMTKCFELWVTETLSEPLDVEFYVNYTVDGDGDPASVDPVLPWTKGQMIYHRTEGAYDVFRYETTFADGSYIYWKFFMLNAFTWISDLYGPELIDQEGMINKEELALFAVSGYKFDYRTDVGLEAWTIELYEDGVKIDETQTGPDGFYEFIGVGMGDYKVCEINKTDEGWIPHGPTCYDFTVDVNNTDFRFDFYNYKMLRLTDTSDDRLEQSVISLVFTPSNDDSELYKLSSTNPGSFYYNTAWFGTPGSEIKIDVSLPDDQANSMWYDSPNFIFHHAYVGSTPALDFHVYGGRQMVPGGSDWIPDWSNDITKLFDITVLDGKHATIEGVMPPSGEVFATVHIDYQISASLTWSEVLEFNNFVYIFAVTVDASDASIHGVTSPTRTAVR